MFGKAFMADLARRQQEQGQPSFGMAQELFGRRQNTGIPGQDFSPMGMMSQFIHNREQEQSNRGLLAAQGMLGKGSGRGRGLLGTVLDQMGVPQTPQQEAIKAPQESQEKGMAIMQGKAEAASQISNQAANQAQMQAQDVARSRALAAMSHKPSREISVSKYTPTAQETVSKLFPALGSKGILSGLF